MFYRDEGCICLTADTKVLLPFPLIVALRLTFLARAEGRLGPQDPKYLNNGDGHRCTAAKQAVLFRGTISFFRSCTWL